MSEYKCIVNNCPGGKRYFSIPESVAVEWCQNLNIDPSVIKTRSRVCDLHFEENCLGLAKLRRGAMPTLHLGHDAKPEFRSNCRGNGNERHCCIVGCDQTRPPSVLHEFPHDSLERAQWKSLCNIKPKYINHVRLHICNQHFHPLDIGRTNIRRGALPMEQHHSRNIDPDIRDQGSSTSTVTSQAAPASKPLQVDAPPNCPRCEENCRNEALWRKMYSDLQVEYDSLMQKCLQLESNQSALANTKKTKMSENKN